MSEIEIADAPDEDRYVVDVDGNRAGFVSYQRTDDQIALMHAEVDPPMRRQGVASQLIAFALDDARAQGLSVLPFCPFVRDYLQRHQDYLELVPPGARARFGL
jgi:predicted GNAT family acetyltransferase